MHRSITKAAHADHMRIYNVAVLSFITLALYMLLSMHPAHASPFTVCTVALLAGSSVQNGIAFIGVLIVGLTAALGKISWTMALVVAVGISIMSHIDAIISTITGGYLGGC